jgi:PPOX class probable F420-dependent enzyme
MHHRFMPREPLLEPDARRFVAGARQAILATMDPERRPRLVPICHVLAEQDDRLGRPRLYSPIDEKPKASADPRALARVRDLLILPEAVVLVDRWDEDWSRLGWIRLYGRGELLEPQPHEREEHAAAVEALRAKYPQYADHRLENRPIIRVTIDAVRSWGDIRA